MYSSALHPDINPKFHKILINNKFINVAQLIIYYNIIKPYIKKLQTN